MTAATPIQATVRLPSRSSQSWNPIARYTRWLHTMWPAGTVEKLPVVREDGSTNVPGIYIVGDLTGIPLLKFSADTGAKAVGTIAEKLNGSRAKGQGPREGEASNMARGASPARSHDLLIIGGGVSGMAAALEAKKRGLDFAIVEAAEPFSTIVNFPKGKPIYTYPTEMKPAGDLQFRAKVKEPLVEEIKAQTAAIEPILARVARVRRDGDELVAELAKADPKQTDGHKPGDRGERGGANGSPESAEIRAKFVIIAIGRSGNFRKLNVPGEDSGKVFNRLHDPKEFGDKKVLVVGGGDSAVETAIAIAQFGGHVTFSFRDETLTRPKPENIEKLNRLIADPSADVQIEKPKSDRETAAVGKYMDRDRKDGAIVTLPKSHVKAIRDNEVVIETTEGEKTFPNDAVFTMIGREAPLDFLRSSGVKVHGDKTAAWWISLLLFLAFCVWMYHWKKAGVTITGSPPVDARLDVGSWWQARGLFPHNVPPLLAKLGEAWNRPSNLLGVIKNDLGQPGFYYSTAYCLCVVIFGIDRVRRRKTPYVKWQTTVLALVQVIPLFLLPYILLPWAGHNGWFANGTFLGGVADHLFEPYDAMGHDRAYWRSFGFILAWPLFIFNVFTDQPMWTWLIISLLQTFVAIPLIIYFWGKGAYCGWICSCGALAETLGDRHRTKMPHGPFWNRFNMVGQVFLAFAFALLALRIIGWMTGQNSFADRSFHYLAEHIPLINYKWLVDLVWAGIIGVGLYFWFSGRVWCRFACPLAALMHIYARFSRFRILADKKKCISCNVCTSVCHQGIDVMNFANKGMPMADPECVRCSACVQSCPTGVLWFGQVDRATGKEIKSDPDWLGASPVRIKEIGVRGRKVAV